MKLSEMKWEVKGYWPYVPIKETSMETGQTLHGVTDWIKATVPGGVHYDLWREGLIDNPYFGQNSLKCEWVENRWWMYRTKFDASDIEDYSDDKIITINFGGLDYECEIFLNDKSLGTHIGMYEAYESENITPILKETDNTLLVLFKGVPKEMGQIGYTSKVFTQKSRFNYKWDFSTRLVNIGMWKDGEIRVKNPCEISDVHIDTDYDAKVGIIYFSCSLAKTALGAEIKPKIKVKITGPYDKRSSDVLSVLGVVREKKKPEIIAEKVFDIDGDSFDSVFTVKKPSLWEPNTGLNDGETSIPWIYDITASLVYDDDTIGHTVSYETGIRSLEMQDNDNVPENAPKYVFTINSRKQWIKGVNITPLDHLYGNVSDSQYAALVCEMVNGNINMARVWGGGLIEKEILYKLCDENGIMIWQEFIQSSSGIDNTPSDDDNFLDLLAANVTSAIKEKRNHTCLTIYGGGNELMDKNGVPLDFGNRNIDLMNSLVKELDGHRPFVPTSAYGPREYITRENGVSYDVHGWWQYAGNPNHYETYAESDNMFHSEFGMDGAAHVNSLENFIPEKSLHPTPMSGNADWKHHGEWWGTYFRDCGLFGEIPMENKNLEEFVSISQYMMSEGLRFIIEADRKRAYQNSGDIIWQLNEPWPNSSCTSLVDYYSQPKSAYYMAKRCYGTRRLGLDYRRLNYRAGERITMPIYAMNTGDKMRSNGRYRIYTLHGDIINEAKFECIFPENGSAKTGEVNFVVPKCDCFVIRLGYEIKDMMVWQDGYVFSTLESDIYSPLRKLRGYAVHEKTVLARRADGGYNAEITIRNTSEQIAFECGVFESTGKYIALADDNYFTLMPGEAGTVRLTLIPREAGSFLSEYNFDGEAPVFGVRSL